MSPCLAFSGVPRIQDAFHHGAQVGIFPFLLIHQGCLDLSRNISYFFGSTSRFCNCKATCLYLFFPEFCRMHSILGDSPSFWCSNVYGRQCLCPAMFCAGIVYGRQCLVPAMFIASNVYGRQCLCPAMFCAGIVYDWQCLVPSTLFVISFHSWG